MTSPTPGELALVHRLAIAYLLAPVAVWLLGWFHWWASLPATALLVVGAWQALSGSWRWHPSRTTVVLALVAGAWVATTPAGGIFPVAADWPVHRAILLDLSREGWPAHPFDYLSDSPPMLRYYLGWHMVPALFGRWLGPSALNWAVPLWTWCGATLVALLFARGLSTLRAAVAAVAVLALFSGMDLLEMLLHEGVPDAVRALRDKLDPEWVPPIGQSRQLDFARTPASPMFLEYQSPGQIFSITPQHFLPACLGTLLMLRLRERRRFLGAIGVVLACCLFWSPLLATSLLLLAAAMLVKNRHARHVASWQNLFAAVPLAALIALYMTSGRIDFERAWLWEFYDDRARMAIDVSLLYATEFMVLGALLWRLDPRVVRDPMLLTAVAILLVVPWCLYGPLRILWDNALHRLTIPAQVMLAHHAARAVVVRPPGKLSRARPAYVALLAVLAVGAVTSAWQTGLRMHQRPGFLPYEALDHSLLTHTTPLQERQKSTYSVRPSLGRMLRDHDGQRNDKGRLLIRSAWDVYLRDNQLVYVKQRCHHGDGQARMRFYVDVHPASIVPQRARAGPTNAGHERFVFGLIPWKHYRDSGGCVIPFGLPNYDIARITTGQLGPDGDAIWEAEAHLTPNPPARKGAGEKIGWQGRRGRVLVRRALRRSGSQGPALALGAGRPGISAGPRLWSHPERLARGPGRRTPGRQLAVDDPRQLFLAPPVGLELRQLHLEQAALALLVDGDLHGHGARPPHLGDRLAVAQDARRQLGGTAGHLDQSSRAFDAPLRGAGEVMIGQRPTQDASALLRGQQHPGAGPPSACGAGHGHLGRALPRTHQQAVQPSEPEFGQ